MRIWPNLILLDLIRSHKHTHTHTQKVVIFKKIKKPLISVNYSRLYSQLWTKMHVTLKRKKQRHLEEYFGGKKERKKWKLVAPTKWFLMIEIKTSNLLFKSFDPNAFWCLKKYNTETVLECLYAKDIISNLEIHWTLPPLQYLLPMLDKGKHQWIIHF